MVAGQSVSLLPSVITIRWGNDTSGQSMKECYEKFLSRFVGLRFAVDKTDHRNSGPTSPIDLVVSYGRSQCTHVHHFLIIGHRENGRQEGGPKTAITRCLDPSKKGMHARTDAGGLKRGSNETANLPPANPSQVKADLSEADLKRPTRVSPTRVSPTRIRPFRARPSKARPVNRSPRRAEIRQRGTWRCLTVPPLTHWSCNDSLIKLFSGAQSTASESSTARDVC